MGSASDWTLTGDASFNDGVDFADNPDDSAALTGAAQTAFDAAVSNSTAYSVTLTSDLDSGPFGALTGTITLSMKGGVPVDFVFAGVSGATVNHAVTSGAGSGFLLDVVSGSTIGGVVDVEVLTT